LDFEGLCQIQPLHMDCADAIQSIYSLNYP
jgi:hypothetical protein